MLQFIPMYLQWVPLTSGSSMRHGCNMKRNISPTEPRRRPFDDLVEDIVDALGGVGHRCLVLSKAQTVAKVRRAIEDSSKFFGRWDRYFSRDGRAIIARDAEELADLIAPLEATLKRLSGPLADYLFGPPSARHVVWTDSVPEDDIIAAIANDKADLLARLERLRTDCERQLRLLPPYSSGPERDRLNGRCARFAFTLMKAFSRRKRVSSGGGAFSVVTSLIYEFLTGVAGVELERACKQVIAAELEIERAKRFRRSGRAAA